MVLVDLICYGILTDFLWKKYLYDRNVKCMVFRLKEREWEDRYIRIHMAMKLLTLGGQKRPFSRFFLAGNCYSESFYECRFRDSSSTDFG
jgi:hypothetical protein